MIFTGKMVSAEEAFKMGMVNKVCERTPDGRCHEDSRLIASKGKVSLRAAKQAVNNGLKVDLATGCDIEIETFALCFQARMQKRVQRLSWKNGPRILKAACWIRSGFKTASKA